MSILLEMTETDGTIFLLYPMNQDWYTNDTYNVLQLRQEEMKIISTKNLNHQHYLCKK